MVASFLGRGLNPLRSVASGLWSAPDSALLDEDANSFFVLPMLACAWSPLLAVYTSGIMCGLPAGSADVLPSSSAAPGEIARKSLKNTTACKNLVFAPNSFHTACVATHPHGRGQATQATLPIDASGHNIM